MSVCEKREEARNMGLTGADLARLGPAAQRQIMERLGMGNKAAPAASKYHNEKTARVMPSGSTHVFDSQKEARRYDELAMLLKAGKIRKLQLVKGGADHKVTCHHCRRRRYGATYADGPAEHKDTKSKAKA